MRISRLLLVGCLLGAFAAHAADREYRGIVRAISSEFNTEPMRIPFFGLVNVVTFFVKPAGAKHIDLSIFNDLGEHRRAGGDLSIAIRHAVGPGWNPLLRSRSNRDGDEELVYVYTRPDGKDWRVLFATVDRDNATVVELLLDPKAMEKWLADPRRSVLDTRGGQGRSNKRFDP